MTEIFEKNRYNGQRGGCNVSVGRYNYNCTLRTSDCNGNPLLKEFDNTLRAALSTILNVDLNNDQWIQASLPVRNGELGIRSAQMLAPSAFLASAASTFELQQSVLLSSIKSAEVH